MDLPIAVLGAGTSSGRSGAGVETTKVGRDKWAGLEACMAGGHVEVVGLQLTQQGEYLPEGRYQADKATPQGIVWRKEVNIPAAIWERSWVRGGIQLVR